MEIIVAKNAGFCYGVKNAISIAESIDTNRTIYTYGELIHNNQEIDRLKKLNIIPIDGLENINDDDYLVIRSHGVGRDFYEKYGSRDNLVDATCPNVTSAQRHGLEYSKKGYQVIVFGDRSHPEVKGILNWSRSGSYATLNIDDLGGINTDRPILLLSQTTQSMDDFNSFRDALIELYPEVVVKNTICGATRSRQSEVIDLANSVDTVIVIGGRKSSNSNKLYKLSKDINPSTYFVETSLNLIKDWYIGKNKIGITAGASTPSWLIEEVIAKMINDEKMEKEQTMEELLKEEVEIDVQAGEIVEGTVIQIGKENIIVDIGLKAEGILAIEEYGDEELPKVGDKVSAVLLQKSNSVGVPVLSKRKLEDRKRREEQRSALKTLPSIYENKEELEGIVVGVTKAGLIVRINELVDAFLPASQILLRGYAKNLDKFKGEKLRVRIIDLDLKKRLPKIVVSQKVILAEESAVLEKDFWEKIEEGSVVKGTVKVITDFGAFINLGYLDGLLHISELSWDRREKLNDLLAVGDEVSVKIIGLDKEKNKISLSMKALEDNPWEVFLKNHKAGHIVTGSVVSLVDYGAFINISKMVEGLLHISEISHEKIEKSSDKLKVGDSVEVEILEIDTENKKVSLSMKSLEAPPVKEVKPIVEEKMVYNDDSEEVTLGDILKVKDDDKEEE